MRDFSRMNILIFGATGFIGSKFAEALINRGDRVYILQKSEVLDFWKISECFRNQDVDGIDILKKFEVADFLILRELELDFFVHFACGLVPSSKKECFFKEYSTLIEPSLSLLDTFCDLQIPVIYLSSAGAIYRDSPHPLSEQSELGPTTFYGYSKYILERYIKKKHREGLPFLVLRPTNVYGRDLDNVNSTQGLIENSILSIIKLDPIKQFGAIPKTRDFLFIDDLISAILSLIDDKIFNETFNVGSGTLLSVNTVIEIINEILELEANIQICDERSFDKEIVDVSVDKLREAISFKPLGIREGLKKYICSLDLKSLQE